jgi:methylthioribose-1-phosphate isomerase
MPKTKRSKKARVTVSLSRDAVAYLQASRAHAQAPSLSAYLEDVVKDLRAKSEMDKMEANAVAYYDNLSREEIEEQSDWGKVGAASLSRLED